VPQGYAYGIWSYLERKYRNTEQDNVAVLWKEFVTLAQSTDETFDEYKARVDSVVELLTHAKQQPPASLYSTMLVWNLQPRYATAVLTLKTGDRLKDPATIDWMAITEYMAQYERSQQGLGETSAAESERALVARARPQWQPSSASAALSSGAGGGGRKHKLSHREWLKTAECFCCHKMGHVKADCPKKKDSQPGKSSPGRTKKKSGTAASSGSDDDSSGSESATESARMARQVNRFAVLQPDEDVADEPVRDRTYLARVLIASKATASAAANTSKKSSADAGSTAAAAAPAAPRQTKSLDEMLQTTAKAVDSAATVSTSCKRECLEGVRRCKPILIKMADGTVLSAMYKGTLTLRLPVMGDPHGRHVQTKIPDVYYHERFDANLLSWGLMRRQGWEMHSTKAGTHLVTPGGKKVNASTRGEMTILEDVVKERVYSLGGVVCMTAKELLAHHRRLGHVSWSRLVEMCKAGKTVGIGDIRGIPTSELEKAEKAVKECAACCEAKAHRKALGHRGLDKGAEAGAVLHMDTISVVVRDPATGQHATVPVGEGLIHRVVVGGHPPQDGGHSAGGDRCA
jgi:hypothetical protein